MNSLKDSMAKALAGGNTLTPSIKQSCNVKIADVQLTTSQKGNPTIVMTLERAGKVRETSKEYVRSSQVSYVYGQRRKIDLIGEICGVGTLGDKVITPIVPITDEKGEIVEISTDLKDEALDAELDRLNEKYGTREYINFSDESGKVHRCLMTVNSQAVPQYLESVTALLKKCVGKTMYAEVTGTDKKGYPKFSFSAPRTA